MMLRPLPLYYKVPEDIRENALRENCAELSPDFLCFETFYQAVAMSWPKDFTIVDIGGFIGLQGWLFKDFRRYICVDNFEFFRHGMFMPKRAELPPNGEHVSSDGLIYLDICRGMDDNLDHTVFVCSAVPSELLRQNVLMMDNSVVWYPGLGMGASGPYAKDTILEFDRLERSGWNEAMSEMVMREFRRTEMQSY